MSAPKTGRQRIKAMQVQGFTGRFIAEKLGLPIELVGKVMANAGGVPGNVAEPDRRAAQRRKDEAEAAKLGIRLTYDDIERSRGWA